MYNLEGLDSIAELKYAVSEVADGNLSYAWGEKEEVLENRKKFLEKYGFDAAKTVFMQVYHSEVVTTVTVADAGKGYESMESAVYADGLITKDLGLNLFLLIADCTPTVVYDKIKKVLALVHINPMNPGIAKVTVEKFVREFRSNPKDLIVSMGPAIKKESYKFAELWQKQKEEWQPYLADVGNGETSIDQAGFISNVFVNVGVSKENIFVSDVDTAADKSLFSHYRAVRTGEKEGRFAVVIGMVEQ